MEQNTQNTTQICKDCGNKYELTPGEIQFFRANLLEIPKRCKPCRSKRKFQKQNNYGKGNNTNN